METILNSLRQYEGSLRDKGLLPEVKADEPVQLTGIAATVVQTRMPSASALEQTIKRLKAERT